MDAAHISTAIREWYYPGVVAVIAFLSFGVCSNGQEPASAPAENTQLATPSPTPVSLAARIDQLLTPEIELLNAPEAEAGPLLRRLSLDLRGVVPTQEELDAFVADQAPDRWANWVDKFLADPLCDEHLVTFLDRTLMLRRGHVNVDRMAWINYLREQVAADASLDFLSKQLLGSPWWNNEHRPAQRFFLDRGGDPNLITRDLSRVFLGRDMQCAQCHDHPLVDDFKQIDYHGLLAFVSPSSLTEVTYKDAEGKDQKAQFYVERAAGDAPFESVFDKGVSFRTGPRFIEQSEQLETYQMPDARYLEEAPAGSLAGAILPPKQSRRQVLAEQLASRSNRAFVTNWANRLWSFAFGQGLVYPLDMHHPHNPAVHPELLRLISDGLVESDMGPRKFLRELVLSQTYRRGSVSHVAQATGSASHPQLNLIRTSATASRDDAISKKVALAATETETLANYESARDAWLTVQGERAKTRMELDAAEAAMLAAKQKFDAAAALLAAAQKRQTDTASRVSLLAEAAGKLQEAVNLAGAEDAELKQALVVVQQRADVARATLPEVEQAVADTKAATDATAPELATTTAKVEEIVAKLQPVHQALSEADAAMVAARTQWTAACQALKNNEIRARRHEQILAWLDSFDSADKLAKELETATQAVATVEAELPASDSLIAAAEAQLTSAQQAEQVAATEIVRATEVVNRQATEVAQLQQSLDALVASTNLVSTAEPLVAAQSVIGTELEARRNQTTAHQSALDAAKQAAVVAAMASTARTQELTTHQAARKDIDDRIAAARAIIANHEVALAASKTTVNENWTAIHEDNVRQLATATLQPLTPEQICWSTLRITGVLDAYIRTEAAELEKQSPLAADADAATKAVRHRQAVRGAVDKLRGIADVYVSLYSSGPDNTEDDFFASADQALYIANAGSVHAWAGPGNDNVTQRAIALTDNAEIARLIYWTLLARQPTEEEVKFVSEQLVASGDGRNVVIQEMVWGLLASAEFRFVN
ncbi:MAG: DUF1549 domain-containing protein [Pirellulaceae bacterium]|nr:DUF1549 domain-containing protein [Pirellulaceae bacterium]